MLFPDPVTCPTKVGREPSALPRAGDNWANLLVNNAFPCNGRVIGWEYYRASASGTAFLGVWRQVSGSEFTLIGKTRIPAGQVGFHAVSTEIPIRVNQGDFIGVHYPRAQRSGVVASSIAGDKGVPINELFQNYYIQMFDDQVVEGVPVDVNDQTYSITGTTLALRAIMDYPAGSSVDPQSSGPFFPQRLSHTHTHCCLLSLPTIAHLLKHDMLIHKGFGSSPVIPA